MPTWSQTFQNTFSMFGILWDTVLHVSARLHVSINLCRVADVLVNALIYHVYKLELSMSTPMCRQLIFFTNFVPKTFKCYQFEIAHPPHIAFK